MKILYAEDEKQLSMAVSEILKMEGYEVDAVYDGMETIEHLQVQSYDAAILDIMMPKKDGIQVLEEMRNHQDYTPVMLLTARTQVEDRIDGLKIGADDYLGKPFDMRELMARLESMIRRAQRYQDKILRMKNVTLDCKTCELSSAVCTLRLSSAETNLLAHFMRKPDDVYRLEELRSSCFPDASDDNVVRLYLSYLKNKLAQLQSERNIIEKEGKIYLS